MSADDVLQGTFCPIKSNGSNVIPRLARPVCLASLGSHTLRGAVLVSIRTMSIFSIPQVASLLLRSYGRP